MMACLWWIWGDIRGMATFTISWTSRRVTMEARAVFLSPTDIPKRRNGRIPGRPLDFKKGWLRPTTFRLRIIPTCYGCRKEPHVTSRPRADSTAPQLLNRHRGFLRRVTRSCVGIGKTHLCHHAGLCRLPSGSIAIGVGPEQRVSVQSVADFVIVIGGPYI